MPAVAKLKPGLDWIERMELSRHHLIQGIDSSGLPYFDVLLRRPYAEAAHDFPDFADLVGRYWEACLIVQEVTGKPVESEPLLRERALGLFSEPDGWTYNPATRFSYPKIDVFGMSRFLFVRARLAKIDPSQENRIALQRTVRAIKDHIWQGASSNPQREASFATYFLRPLAEASMVLNDEEPLDMAWRLAASSRSGGKGISDDGTWTGHVHSHLTLIAGIVSCGALKNDRSMVEWGLRAFQFFRQFATEFGWLPELVDRRDDCVGCETCAIMDYLDSAVQLARAGHSEFWDLIERATRNQLAESQLTQPGWLLEPPDAQDDKVTIQREVAQRMLGAFAGWSSPLGVLAYDEPYVRVFWKESGPGPWDQILGGRIRALQNCCAGSGTKAFYRVWQEASRIENQTLVVELLFGRQFPQATVTAGQPFGDGITVRVNTPLSIKVRLPGDAKPRSLAARKDGMVLSLAVKDGYLSLDRLLPGEEFQVNFQRPERTERVSIGNPGFKHFDFDVRWHGATVLGIEPATTNASMGFNYLLQKETVLHMKGEVEHPFYKREEWRSLQV